MKHFIICITFGLFSAIALAQSPTEYAALKAASKVTFAGGTKQVTDEKNAASTVRDTDAVIVSRPVFDPATGAQTGTTSTTFSISGLEKDIARMQAELAAAQAMLVDLKAVK